MAERAIDVYLNDHLAGALVGSNLADQIRDQNEKTHLGELMKSISRDIGEDRQTLADLMQSLGTETSTLKQASGWLADKVSTPKFSGLTSGDSDLGTFLALEGLLLGVQGKLCLWQALKEIAQDVDEPLADLVDLDELIARAEAQIDILDKERRSAVRRTLLA